MPIKDSRNWESYQQNFLPTVKIKDYNVLIDGKNFLDQPAKNDFRRNDNTKKTAIGQGDDYTTCLLDYPYFKKY